MPVSAPAHLKGREAGALGAPSEGPGLEAYPCAHSLALTSLAGLLLAQPVSAGPLLCWVLSFLSYSHP